MECLCGHGESCPKCNPYYHASKDPRALRAQVEALEKANRSLIERNANLEAEVARLREELVSRHGAAAYMAQRNRADAAERRVAELEGALQVVSDRAVSEALLRQDALSSARSLLGRAHQFGISHPAIRRDVGEWLRAHPEPATPAATGACDNPECDDACKRLHGAEKERKT